MKCLHFLAQREKHTPFHHTITHQNNFYQDDDFLKLFLPPFSFIITSISTLNLLPLDNAVSI